MLLVGRSSCLPISASGYPLAESEKKTQKGTLESSGVHDSMTNWAWGNIVLTNLSGFCQCQKGWAFQMSCCVHWVAMGEQLEVLREMP